MAEAHPKACKDCCYWQQNKYQNVDSIVELTTLVPHGPVDQAGQSLIDKRVGLCRRFPPTMMWGLGSAEIASGWSRSWASDWCGEWQAND